ncbi:PEP-CTERM sorting domain-containing protein [Aeoliella sp. SH292]|uniref:PEP-CTERM sorting domain-containing protein n=1 Tax=Aeoliella sp. SH292 TaxID=3454464 RepID=UPI003F9A13DF
MKRHLLTTFVAGGSALALLIAASPASAVNLFSATDNILAIDADPTVSSTPVSGNEDARFIADQVFVAGPPSTGTTKYLNFARVGSGFIVTPTAGSTNVQSLQLRAANDASERDPLTYTLYGTNDPITSAVNSTGTAESWTVISSGATGLGTDPGRHELGSIEDIANGASYSSYKMVFNTMRNLNAANSLQVADVQFFTGTGGSGSAVLSAADMPSTIGIADGSGSQSRYPAPGEAPSRAFDGASNTKYLNFGRENTGVILSRADGQKTIVQSIQLVTGGDAPQRDPLTWILQGTNDPIVSTDNSLGILDNWVMVDSGDSGLATDPGRNLAGSIVSVDNNTPYAAYRLVFPTLRDAGATNSMQVSEIILDGQVVPEPSTFVMVGMAVTALGLVARRRNTRSA